MEGWTQSQYLGPIYEINRVNEQNDKLTYLCLPFLMLPLMPSTCLDKLVPMAVVMPISDHNQENELVNLPYA